MGASARSSAFPPSWLTIRAVGCFVKYRDDKKDLGKRFKMTPSTRDLALIQPRTIFGKKFLNVNAARRERGENAMGMFGEGSGGLRGGVG